jgi:hypothetical protein
MCEVLEKAYKARRLYLTPLSRHQIKTASIHLSAQAVGYLFAVFVMSDKLY